MIKERTNMMQEIIISKPNWLGSAVGQVLKTIQIPANFNTYVTHNGRKIVESGTMVDDTLLGKGLLYNDVDITDGPAIASLMIRGSYIDANLPASAASWASDMAARGMYAIAEGDFTRPDFGGDDSLTALSVPVVSVSVADVTWTAISEVVAYEVTDADKETIAYTEDTGYTFTALGDYFVRALGNNLDKTHSTYVSFTIASLEE